MKNLIPIIFVLTFFSCSEQKENTPKFWNDFQSQIKANDLNKLVASIQDSVYCGYCESGVQNISSQKMIEEYRQFMMEPEYSKVTLFVDSSDYYNEKTYHLIFEMDCVECPAGAYNIVFDFVQNEGQPKLAQLFTVP